MKISQNSWGWKTPPEVICSDPPAEAGPPTASSRGPCPDNFLISAWTETPQPPSQLHSEKVLPDV